MSALENAVHELLEVAAGRHNLTGEQADQHHLAIDGEAAAAQDAAAAAPQDPQPAEQDTPQPADLPAPPYAPEAAQPAAAPEVPSGL